MEQNTIGTKTARRSLLHALAYYGLDGMDYTEKEELRDLILTRKTYTPEERIRILDYCQQDVLAIEDLLPHMLPRIPGLIECIKSSSKKVPGWSQALFRGRYMCAVTKMTKVGVPIDVELYGRVMEVRPQIRQRLINVTNAKYDVYDGDKFKLKKFAEIIRKLDIWWPVTQTKKPKTDEETFKTMSLTYPELEDLASARRAIGELNSSSLVVKADGYSRAWLGPFLANTGRNLPRKSEDGGRFIFGMSAWFRSFIRPREGRAIAYVDWSQQEVAIMAGLSRDPAMIAAYNSGDCYLEFAKGVGAVPPTATKKSHPRERELYKTCFLAMPYGQGDKSLARRLKVSLVEAQDMIAAHRDLYHVFWQWTEINTVHAPHKGEIFTPLGWRMRIVDMDGQKKASGKIHSNYRTLLNWPMQSVGADMMRLAACMASEGGLRIAAPIHDAFLLESSIDNLRAMYRSCRI